MFSKFYEYLYLKIFVNIVISGSKTVVYVESINAKGRVNSSEAEFNTKVLSEQMKDYILLQTKESPYSYVSILDYSTAQGAIPTCSKQNMNRYYDLSFSEYKCYDEKWAYYTLKNDIFEIQKVYKKIGIDFIFSPFVVLANFFKDKINTHTAMFILVEENILYLSIFNKGELLYAQQLDINLEMLDDGLMMEDEETQDLIIEDAESSIDLDDIDTIDDIDELDDFADIEDLDALEEIIEFDDSKDLTEELAENKDKEDFPQQSPSSMGHDYQRFVTIQSAVDDFYKNDMYKSEFIENAYIADSVGVSSDLKKYLEEEMFLNVYIRHIDLCLEIYETTKIELS